MRKNWGRKPRKSRLPFVFLWVLAAFYLFPVVFAALQSFVAPEEIYALYTDAESTVYRSLRCAILPRAFSLRQYYEVLLGDSVYMVSFWNSAALSVACTLLNTIVAIGLGYMLATTRFFLRKWAIRFVAMTMLLPWQAMMLPNYLLSKWLGVYDTWLALILTQGFSSFSVFLLFQFMRSVPEDVLDAASLDTGSSLVILARVACPIAMPGIVACLALSFAESWNMVEQPLTLIEDARKYPLSMLVNSMSLEHADIAFACGVIYLFPILAIGVWFGRKLLDGMAVLHTGGTIDGADE